MTEVFPTEKRIAALAAALDAGDDLTNSLRGARVMAALLAVYQDDAAGTFADALADLYHAADLLGLDFDAQRRQAHANYSAEVAEEGPAPHIYEGWIGTEGQHHHTAA